MSKNWFSLPTLTALAMTVLMGCVSPPGRDAAGADPQRIDRYVPAADGYRLPLRSWQPEGETKAAVLALHGFNDYGEAFANLRPTLVAERSMALYAYDQRGFGVAPEPGRWAGTETYVDDALAVLSFLRARHPDTPLYLLGESMGASVAMLAAAQNRGLPVDGLALVAPAVWGFDGMPWYQRTALWLAMKIMPGAYFTSEPVRRLGIRPTDDPAVMRELSNDPLVQKGARVEALHGVSVLMDRAAQVQRLPVPTLILYGLSDDIIPADAVCLWLRELQAPPSPALSVALYPEGYHMLTRYTGASQVIRDLAAWLSSRPATLPSGHEQSLRDATDTVCAR